MTAVGELMTETPLTASSNDLVGTTRDALLNSGVHCVPVIDDEGRPVGIVSSWDLVEEYAPQESIRNAMTTNVRTIGSHQEVEEAAVMMQTNFIHHLVVVDDSNHTIGFVSSLDLLTAILER